MASPCRRLLSPNVLQRMSRASKSRQDPGFAVTSPIVNNPYLNRFKPKHQIPETFFKQTTGLRGLEVRIAPHNDLTLLYGRILKALEQIPSTAAYRKYTEQIVKHRLALVQSEPDIEKLEEKIGMGQIEEVVEQAQYELETLRKIIESRAWEPLVENAPKGQWDWPVA